MPAAAETGREFSVTRHIAAASDTDWQFTKQSKIGYRV
jgi:hypothetical protein